MLPSPDQQSASIKFLIQICSDIKDTFIDSQFLADTVGISKRRFHDILNVLETMGCIHKITSTLIKWNGFGSFKIDILKYAEENHVRDRNYTLSQIIPSKESCTICTLTKNVFMMFIAMNTEVLNMKDICLFTVRKHGKLQSIMCKLYQIIHILVASEFIVKINQGDIKLIKPLLIEEEENELSIEALLNKPVPYKIDIYDERRKEFIAICEKQRRVMSKKVVENTDSGYSD